VNCFFTQNGPKLIAISCLGSSKNVPKTKYYWKIQPDVLMDATLYRLPTATGICYTLDTWSGLEMSCVND
jgi:hypothetical protein